MLSKSGEEKKRNPCIKFFNFREMKIRETVLATARRRLFDQRWHDTLLTGSPCYGGGGKKPALLRFNGFHLYRLGVTTSNILEILA